MGKFVRKAEIPMLTYNNLYTDKFWLLCISLTLQRSLTQTRKRRGPKINPWGTSTDMRLRDELQGQLVASNIRDAAIGPNQNRLTCSITKSVDCSMVNYYPVFLLISSRRHH